MKIFNSIFLLLVSVNFCLANVWQGDYLIQSQADADAFTRVCDCTLIEGDLVISGEDIVYVDSLYALTSVNGSVEILDNEQLHNLNGFSNLLEVKKDLIIANNKLIILENFESLKHIGNDLKIRENEHLEEITGFKNLNIVDNDIWISVNPKLKNFVVFKQLQYCRDLRFYKNEHLISIKEFGNLTNMRGFKITGHENLQLIGGFNKVYTIDAWLEIIRNTSLHTINGFNELQSVPFLQIHDNIGLRKINGFEQLEKATSICTIFLPDAINNGTHFPNLKAVGELETNISNFQNLESIHRLSLLDHFITEGTLVGLPNVKLINSLLISGNDSIKYITGFDDLEEAGKINIVDNKNLVEIGGFNALKLVYSPLNRFWNHLTIENNPSLQKIKGFNQLKNISGGLEIRRNDTLNILEAFNQLEEVVGNFFFEVPQSFSTKNYFSSLKRIEGSLYSSETNFQALEKVSIINIQRDILNNDTLNGYPALKYAWLIFINGNYKESLKHIDAFPALEAGSIEIRGNNDLRTIKGFNNLQTIQLNLIIRFNNSLEDITAFNKLSEANNIEIHGNGRLKNISGFQNLNIADSIYISNSNLETLSAFDNLNKVEVLQISGNRKIQNLSSFNHLNSAKHIEINSNINLQEIKGFNNLEKLENIDVLFNTNLISVEGFNKLKSINQIMLGNRNLRKLDAFTQLKIINNLNLTDNIQLRSIDNFSNIGFIENELVLANNLQLNNCCLLNCWINQGIVDELNVGVGNNGMSCSGLQSIKNNCEKTNCQTKREILSDLKTNNPVTEQLQFSFIILEDQQAVNYKIYNINKQLIRQGSVTGKKGFNSKTIGMPDTERGFYFLQIEDEDSNEVVKFLRL